MSVPATKTALTDWQNTICRSPPPSLNFEAKATTKVTLYEPPINVSKLLTTESYASALKKERC